MEDNFVNVDNYIDDIDQCMPHFVFYRRGQCNPYLGDFGIEYDGPKNRNVTDCYCTACRTRYEDTIRKPNEYKHKEVGTCANCGETVVYRQMNRGRGTYYFTRNFAVFEGAGDRMRIACIKVAQKFNDPDDLQPELHWYTITKYELQPGKAMQYWRTWDGNGYSWRTKKTKAIEPNFAQGGFFYRDGEYTLINENCIDNSFLRYLWRGEEHPDTMYITWLCRYAEHQQLEYLVHGELFGLAQKIVSQGVGKDVRVNWHSNDLKKMLKLSKAEINYHKQYGGTKHSLYIRFRRNFFKGRNDLETIRYFDEFHSSISYIKECAELTGLSHKKIMDYALRKQNAQGTHYFMTLYKDYLHQCRKLDYDMNSTAVTMPKDMFEAHDRTAALITALADAKLNKIMYVTDQSRHDLEVVDMELGLKLVLPTYAHDIVTEGAKLNHCVGGYADRHAIGKTTIMFLRRISDPKTPYYTVEIANDLHIVQCHGYANERYNPKAAIIEEFERRYTEYLEMLKIKRQKEAEKAKRKSKKKKQHKAKAQVAA